MPKCRIRLQDFLSNVPLFRNLDTVQIARLAVGASEIEAGRGDIVYHRGDSCHGLYFVIYGQVKQSLQTNRGDEMVVELIGPGMSFGEAPLFSGKPYIFTAQTLADSKLLHVAKEVLMEELERDCQFARRVISRLGNRLYQRLGELEGYFLNSGTERVVRYLLRVENACCAGDVDHVTLPATKGVIASRLNLTHEHFSRILRELITAGLIEVDGRDVRILNKKRLYGYPG